MHFGTKRLIRLATALACVAGLGRAARADVGLVIEGAAGRSAFFSDSGHASVWISRACIDALGHLYFCEGTAGVVISGSDYWLATGAAAIPAEDYFLGPEDNPTADERAVWESGLAKVYPDVPVNKGAKYLGRVWSRQVRVHAFATTPEQDRMAIAQLQPLRDRFAYNTLKQNCANFAGDVLRVWLGDGLKFRRWNNAGIMMPVSVERGLENSLGRAPFGEVVTYRFPMPAKRIDRRPALDICSALLFDPKYAGPLLLTQPLTYFGVGGCYAWTHVHDRFASRHELSLTARRQPHHQTARQVFTALTGTVPDGVFTMSDLARTTPVAPTETSFEQQDPVFTPPPLP